MRTPLGLLIAMVFVACGWILDLTTTVAPNWRTIHNISGHPEDLVLHQGIWDICRSFTASRDVLCNHEDIEYFNNQIIEVARRMMLANLIVTLIGLCVVTIGTHCWTNKPRLSVGALGGLLIFSSGVLAIIPVAWYHHILTFINSPSSDIRVGYCIVLGYTGGIIEVLAGLAMFGGLYQGQCHGGKSGEGGAGNIGRSDSQPHPKSDGHGSARRSRASSVPYALESLKQEVNFWRGKTSSASKTL
ncbi:claudin-23-like [Astyanax mexicanus]|uniref:Claudin-23-like n=1 Tax=Astyanax mexicanus TaxID=7994 RepID=A0A8T2MCX7_ASTMX|nr:claudin-23-like [Astyanax mexicanus]KAG9281177.1 claudin-23-like [Astyanax mexicanus]